MYLREDFDIKNPNTFWSGADDTVRTIERADKLDEFEAFIEEYYADNGEVPTLTELNDLLRFDDSWIFEQLGISEEDDDDDE